jgi:hypothetical protein
MSDFGRHTDLKETAGPGTPWRSVLVPAWGNGASTYCKVIVCDDRWEEFFLVSIALLPPDLFSLVLTTEIKQHKDVSGSDGRPCA